MKRILLIASTPSYTSWRKMRLYPPTGLFRLKFWAEAERQCKVDVINPYFIDSYKLLKRSAKNYDIVGVQVFDFNLSHDMANIILAKKYNSKSVVFVGGYGAYNKDLLEKFTPVDYINLGEGEHTLVELIDGLIPTGKALSEEEFQKASMLLDFEEMGLMRYYLENLKQYVGAKNVDNQLRLFTSSTCPNSCNFCSEHNYVKKLKYLTAEQIKELVDRGMKCNISFILFHDDNAIIGKKGKERFYTLSESGYKFPVPFMMQTSVRSVDEDILTTLKSLGMVKFSLGIESFSSEMLKDFNKPQTPEEIENVLKLSEEIGIDVYGNIILSSPNCSVDDIVESAVEIKKWMNRGISFGINLYPLAFAGSYYADNNIGHITYKKEHIPKTKISFKKKDKILPLDTKARKLILDVEAEIQDYIIQPDKLSEFIINQILSTKI